MSHLHNRPRRHVRPGSRWGISRTGLRPLAVTLAALTTAAVPHRGFAVDYRFVRIADTREGNFDLDASRHVALNNAGTVALYRSLPGLVAGYFSGNGGPLATIATNAGGPLAGLTLYRPSINEIGQIAFYADMAAPDGLRIYRADSAGTITPIAVSGAGTFGGFVVDVSINDTGNVGFTAGSGVYLGNGTSNTRLYGNPGDGVSAGSGPSLNNVGSVSFAATYVGAGGPAHLRGDGGVPSVIGSTSVNDLSILSESVVSDGGLVAFGGTRFSGPQGVFTGSGGSVLTTVADVSGPYSNLPVHPSSGFAAGGFVTMNNAGTLAFLAQLDAGGEGIFTGADPTTSSVIQVGAPLFGGIVSNFWGGLGREAINDAGEIAFQVQTMGDFGSTEMVVKAIPFTSMRWADDSDGVWSDGGNWIGPVPNAFHHDANFTAAITAPRTVTVDGSFTVGSINFDNSNSYTVAGPGTITLDDSYMGHVSVASGTHSISAPFVFGRDTTINMGASTGLTITSPHAGELVTIEYDGGASLLNMTNYRVAQLKVLGGTCAAIAGGGDAGASRIGTLALAGSLPIVPTDGDVGTLDLNDNDLVVQHGSYSALAGAVAAARNGGAWDSPGITSSAARVHPAGATTLGVMSGAEYESIHGTGASFGPFTVESSDSLVKYTWYGDADFNGLVDFDDYVRIDAGFNGGLTGWLNGDFDLSGVIDFDDYVLIDLGFNSQDGVLRRAVDYLSGDDRSTRGMDPPSLRRVVEHFERFRADYAVSFLVAAPEPGSGIGVGFPVVLAILSRRRRAGQYCEYPAG